MSFNNNPKVILITGTSSGFGLLTSARLAARGFIVYATMRDITQLKPLLNEVFKRRGEVIIRELDVTKPESIKDVVTEIKNRHGSIDVVINNAGFGLGGFFEDLTQEEIRQQMEVNFFGVQNVCRQVIPLMRERKKGTIINISSIAGQCGSPALGAYSASKWALEGFSESLYHELIPFGVHVVLIEPGAYPTKIFSGNARYCEGFDKPNSPYFELSQKLRAFVTKTMANNKKDPEDIAKLIEKVIDTPNPKLRYVSDFSSWMRIVIGRILPASVYTYLFRKVIYGNSKRSV
ncbi:MAG: SDR family oxidoreductase [Candidatus Omnitrophica bacterium]|nr:SDR family oxidoreductase [Candidatus Omnitrophota bacterium]